MYFFSFCCMLTLKVLNSHHMSKDVPNVPSYEMFFAILCPRQEFSVVQELPRGQWDELRDAWRS